MSPAYQAPLTIHICWSTDHPDSGDSFEKLATALYEFLCRPIGINIANDPGVGIPVRVGSDPNHVTDLLRQALASPALDEEVPRVIAIALIDRSTNGDEKFLDAMDEWAELYEKRGTGERILILPVILSPHALMPGDIPPCRGAARITDPQEKRTSAVFEVSTAVAHFLMKGDSGQRRVKIFVSHAKADLAPTDNFAIHLRDYIAKTQLKAFFDANDVASGGSEIGRQLEQAQQEAVFLCLRGDGYSDSPYCLDEMLTAKKYGVPIVCVHALSKAERRSHAYGGNAFTYVRRIPKDGQDEDLETVTKCCLQAWISHLYFHFSAPRIFRSQGIPLSPRYLSRPPELIDFAHSSTLRDSATLIFHPDPPLPQAELAVIQGAYPKVRFATPTTLHRQLLRRVAAPPLEGVRVALSLSDSPDLRPLRKPDNTPPDESHQYTGNSSNTPKTPPTPPGSGANGATHPHRIAPSDQGLTSEHRSEATAYLTLSLIKAGAELGYGGDLQANGDTVRLSDLVEAHKRTTKSGKDRLFNYLASYMWDLDAAEAIRARFLRCRLEKPSQFDKPINNALELSCMRKRMAAECGYRVIMGGKTRPALVTGGRSGYSGRLPGQAEEAYRHMIEGGTGKPVYIVAGLGGCARMVADALCGNTGHLPKDSQKDWQTSAYIDFCDIYDNQAVGQQGDKPMTLDDLWEFFRTKGEGYFHGKDSSDDKPWINGLSVAENRRLFESVNPEEISSLILTGILEIRRKERSTGTAPLHILLYHGSITDVPNVDSYAVPVLAGASLRGADGALDAAMNGAIGLHLKQNPDTTVVPIVGGQLPGDYVILQQIGDLAKARKESEAEQLRSLRESVKEGMKNFSAQAQRIGLTSPAVVPFGSTLGLPVRESTIAMLEGFIAAGPDAQLESVTICEKDRWRYEEILKLRDEIHPPSEMNSGAPREPHELAGQVIFTELRSERSVFDEKVTRPAILLQVRSQGEELKIEVIAPGSGTSVPTETLTVKWEEISRLAHEYGSKGPNTPPAFEAQNTIGSILANKVLPAAARLSLLRHPHTPVDIVHDLESAVIPFELLCLPGSHRGADTPLLPAILGGIRRRLLVNGTGISNRTPFRIHTRVMFLRVLIVGDSMGDLPMAEHEALNLVDDFSKRDDVMIDSLIGREQATRANVMKLLKDKSYDVLHFAGHGKFDSREPSNSGILFDDGLLQARDLSCEELSSLPALIILNACEAARLRDEPESPRTADTPQPPDSSLAETIIAAGINGFIGNMWKVGDRSGAEFSGALYAGLGGGLSLGEAFLEARRTLHRAKNSDWSNFIFYGNPDLRI